MQDGDAARKAGDKALYSLWGEGYLRHQDNAPAAQFYHFRQRLQVYLGLAAASDAVEQKNFLACSLTMQRLANMSKGIFLGTGQLQRRRCGYALTGNRLPPDFYLFYSNKPLAGQGIGRRFVHVKLLSGFCPGHRRSLPAQKIKQGGLFHGPFFPERRRYLWNTGCGHDESQEEHLFGPYPYRLELIVPHRQSFSDQLWDNGLCLLFAELLFQFSEADSLLFL